MNWTLIIPLIAGWLLAIAGWLKAWETSWNASRREVRLIKQIDTLLTENKSLDDDNASMAEANAGIAKERDTAVQAFTELDGLHKKVVTERDKWQGLYGELVNTLHDAQGDAHATVPLQEAVAPEPVKRTRKKAGQQ